MSHDACASSTPATPTRSSGSTTTSARWSRRAAPSCSCAARSGRTSTSAPRSRRAIPRARPSGRWRTSALLLEEAGARLEDVCKITIYLTDPRYREPVYRTVGAWLKGVFPVSTGLVVSALARPEWLVEIDVVAVIPDERTEERAP